MFLVNILILLFVFVFSFLQETLSHIELKCTHNDINDINELSQTFTVTGAIQ